MNKSFEKNNSFNPQESLASLIAELKKHIISFKKAKKGENLSKPNDPLKNCENENLLIKALVNQFNLSPFERNLLLLCAGIELDSEIGKLCGELQGDPTSIYPTLGLALSLFSHGSWQALSPHSPLYYWGLIEKLKQNPALVMTPLKISEKVLHSLMGATYISPQFSYFLKTNHLQAVTTDNYTDMANRIEQLWSKKVLSPTTLPLINLKCEDSTCAYHIAAIVAKKFNVQFYTLDPTRLPFDNEKQQEFQKLMNQHAVLDGCFYLINTDHLTKIEDNKITSLSALLDNLKAMYILFGTHKYTSHDRHVITLDVKKPSALEQKAIWQQALQSTTAPVPDAFLEHLVGHFNFSPTQIYKNVTEAIYIDQATDTPFPQRLWQICVASGRKKLEGLIKIIEPKVTWDDLALPYEQKQTLKIMIAQVTQRYQVYHHWGFADKNSRGLGMSALFAGPSGTGKTLAAEIIAKELGLNLYHVDLSALVSKYIGETEKNLSQVFSVAEESGAILLFDEADALFARRSDVKDSHDRYANMEVSYLLQRIEAYKGLSILTTNLKSIIDDAFLRRIRFVIEFPFPNYAQREEIWHKIFPKKVPMHASLDPAKLACLPIAGGNISAVALNAAFIAAHAGEEVSMVHLHQAAQTEYRKLDRILTEKEIKDWPL